MHELPVTDLQPDAAPDSGSRGGLASRGKRVAIWVLALIELICGGFLTGAAIGTGAGDSRAQLLIGTTLVMAGVSTALYLRRSWTWLRLTLWSACIIAVSPLVLLGLLVFVVYPLAAALR